MSYNYSSEPLLDMFLFETTQLLEQLEACILNTEKNATYTEDDINEIFRIMHTIKGSSAMMKYNNISKLAHAMEDLFDYIKDKQFAEGSMLPKILASITYATETNKNVIITSLDKTKEALEGNSGTLISK